MAQSYNAAVLAVPMPERIAALPVSDKGFPVPWFVRWIDGAPEFRVADAEKMARAVKHRLCWVCGGKLGRVMAMTVGPMCAINRTISEPPSHRDCAVFAARACPFLANPRTRRHDDGLPEERLAPAGLGLARNPGAVGVWLTRGYRPFKQGNGVLFTFDDPEEVLWFASGRAATRAEVLASIESGLPALEALARLEAGGMEALAEMKHAAMQYLPAA